jgi:transcriptional antiterminator Rof (Rho-off)
MAARKNAYAVRLAGTTLELNIAKINSLSSPKLKTQLEVYCDVLKDEVLLKKLWKDMLTVAVRRDLVLEAHACELERRSAG